MLSIIIPVYNAEKNIASLLDSISKYLLDNYEIICINDGSTDKSEEIIRAFAKDNKHIKLITQQNGGPSKARNKGMEIAKGEYIAFADSDDVYCGENWKDVLETIKRQPNADIYIYQYQENIDGKIKMPEHITISRYLNMAFKTNDYLHIHALWNKIYKRKFIMTLSKFEEEIQLGEDAIFNSQCYENANKIVISNALLYSYMISKDSLSHTNKDFKKICDCYCMIMDSDIKLLNKFEKYDSVNKVRYNYVFGIINAYINADSIDKFDNIKLRKVFGNPNYVAGIDYGQFAQGINKIFAKFFKYKLINMAMLLSKIQRFRRKKFQ